MTVTLDLSEGAARLLDKMGREGFVVQALLQGLRAELRRYEREDRRLSRKYGMAFSEFKEGLEGGRIGITEAPGDADRWHIEWRDYMRWTALRDAMERVRGDISVLEAGG